MLNVRYAIVAKKAPQSWCTGTASCPRINVKYSNVVQAPQSWCTGTASCPMLNVKYSTFVKKSTPIMVQVQPNDPC